MTHVYHYYLVPAIVFCISLLLFACDNTAKSNIATQEPELLQFAEQGQLNKINALLKLGEKADTTNSCHWTALMKAAQYGHLDIVKSLLKHGALIDQTDKGGYSALLLAASRNHDDIVSYLIEQGADINLQEKTMGWSALIWATKLNYQRTVKALLEHHADTQLTDWQHNTALMWAKKIHASDIISLLQTNTS